MGCKITETTCNVSNAFGQGTANELQCRGGSRNFAKEMRALKMRGGVASHWEVDSDQLRGSLKLILFTAT